MGQALENSRPLRDRDSIWQMPLLQKTGEATNEFATKRCFYCLPRTGTSTVLIQYLSDPPSNYHNNDSEIEFNICNMLEIIYNCLL